MAYRRADSERWQQISFVVGIRIAVSHNNHPEPDICDDLQGVYPKDFVWTGWHPHCRCAATSVLAPKEERDEYFKRLANGEDVDDFQFSGKVEDVPSDFKKWVEKEADRIKTAKNLPYFIKDNHGQRIVEYARYKSNHNYYDVALDYKSWGLKATHTEHKFDKKKGWYETSVQNIGYKSGYKVIFGSEPQNIYKQRSCEGYWDNFSFEVAGAETATPNNIRNALKHCAAKPDCKIAIVFLPNGFESFEDIRGGISKYFGLRGTNQFREFEKIFVISENGIIHQR